MNLLPIIRRKRRPLIPPDEPRVVVPEVAPKEEQNVPADAKTSEKQIDPVVEPEAEA